MKRTIALLLTIAMVVIMLPLTLVADSEPAITLSTDAANNLAVGDNFTVTATLANNPGYASLTLILNWNSDVVEFKGFSTTYDDDSEMDVLTDSILGSSTVYNQESGIVTVARANNSSKNGTLFIANFEVVGNGNCEIGLQKNYPDFTFANLDKEDIAVTFDESAVQMLKVEQSAIQGYTAGLNTNTPNVSKNGTVTVNVGVAHSSETLFNAAELVLEYDSDKLTFVSVSNSAGSADLKYSVQNGELTIQDFGDDKTFDTANYVITFEAAEVTEENAPANVTLTSAKFIHKENAKTSDLIEAVELNPASVNITISKVTYTVTLPSDENITGNAVASEGDDYTFTVAEPNNYTYDITVTVNGVEIETVTGPDENGTYTIPAAYVTGAIDITYTRSANSYTVTWEGTGAEDVTNKPTNATYNTNFTFTLPADKAAEGLVEGYSYTLKMTIGGAEYNGYSIEEGTRNYTIPGSDIIGNIVIIVTKNVEANETFGVTVDGNGAGNVTVDATPVVKGEDASITLNPETGYTYTVTATIGGVLANVTNSGNVYTVGNVEGNVVFTVTKTLITDGVNVYDYVGGMSLVTFAPTLVEGKVPTYDGSVMYYSEKYAAYCWLVSDNTLTSDVAKTKIDAQTGTAINVNYYMDINKTTKIDAADAQLVWNMYNAMYGDFTSGVTMAQFLAADQNAVSADTDTYGLNVNDALVIINAIQTGTAN